jgi:DeoR/GlpR family transcriptional regulator of sugar metabolism
VSDRDEPPFAEIAVERLGEKERIGRAAADLVRDGQTIMIDIGTTTLQLARQLRDRELTVITSSLAVLEELIPCEGIELIALGGVVRRNYRSLVGVLAEDSLRQLNADVLFLGTSAVDEQLAVWDSTMVEVPIKRAMIAAAGRVVLLADAEKFSMTGSVRVCEADAIHHIVTDAGLPASARAAIDEAGIEVTVA